MSNHQVVGITNYIDIGFRSLVPLYLRGGKASFDLVGSWQARHVAGGTPARCRGYRTSAGRRLLSSKPPVVLACCDDGCLAYPYPQVNKNILFKGKTGTYGSEAAFVFKSWWNVRSSCFALRQKDLGRLRCGANVLS